MRKLQLIWQLLRYLSGDDAYERYLSHFAEHHQQDCPHAGKPLSKKAFFKQWQDEKWNGVKRCC